MKKQNKSIGQQIVEVLEKKGTVKLADIREALPNFKAGYISTAIWNLKKIGVVVHYADSGEYTLTSVNKTEKPTPAKAEPKVNDRRLQEALAEAHIWRENAQSKTMIAEKLNVRYEDALAVVRYLEDKLFKLIQSNARNGNPRV
jgi:hypothetical protein